MPHHHTQSKIVMLSCHVNTFNHIINHNAIAMSTPLIILYITMDCHVIIVNSLTNDRWLTSQRTNHVKTQSIKFWSKCHIITFNKQKPLFKNWQQAPFCKKLEFFFQLNSFIFQVWRIYVIILSNKQCCHHLKSKHKMESTQL